MRFIIIFIFLLSLNGHVIAKETTSKGKEITGIDKFDKAIKEFADSIEKNKSKQSVENFLKILKLQPNKEIIAKISELSGLKKSYPLAYSKSYDWNPVFSLDGKKILFQSWQKFKAQENNAIYIMDIDGKNQRELIDAKFNNISPMFSPDSQSILFLSWREDTNSDGKIDSKDNTGIYIVNIHSKQITEIASPKYKNFEPLFSPDNKYLTFQSFRHDTNGDGKIDNSDNREIYLSYLQLKEEIKISPEYQSYKPVFSPDSKKIAFHIVKKDTNHDGQINFYDNKALIIYDLETKLSKEIISDVYDNTLGSFSKDTKKIVFNSRKKDNRAILSSSIDGTNLKKLVSDEFDNEFLSFSPDNKKIAYSSYRNDTNKDKQINSLDNRAIFLIDISGFEEEIQIVGNKFDNEFLSFYPDGKKVIFQSFRHDTNGDGLIDILDSGSLYIIDILSTPTLKITTLFKKNGAITRIINVVTDPLFKGVSKEQEQALTNKWKTEFIKDGEYHFKVMGEFKNISDLQKENYPIKITKESGLFHTINEYREIFTFHHPFVKLSQELSKASIKKFVIQYKLSVPGEIIDTNAFQQVNPTPSGGAWLKSSTVIWIISVEKILSGDKDYEMFVKYKFTNWGNIAIILILILTVSSIFILKIIYQKIEIKAKQSEMAKEYSETHNYMGLAYKRRGLYEEAIAEFEEAIKFKPDEAISYYNLACAYALKKDDKNTWLHLKKAIELDKNLKDTALTNKELNTVMAIFGNRW
ncbi:MAG: tetratricopeptide repeat protein [Candidatus Firestonebacteria bacterium]